jgi:asparagine synthase (glutamine-hydrolysing)
MCGITGWLELENPDISPEPIAQWGEALSKMCQTIYHRGPDSEGRWIEPPVALGMRRLSIIDVATGDQPVFNEDRTIIVLMNGEIYNFRELRKELERLGHRFRTNCDTEVLPHLYEEFGDELLGKLNGMFAFSLWDARRQKLMLARDRFGEKPLYYGIFDGRLIWGSELKAILANKKVTTELDLDSLREYVSFDYVPAPKTIFKNIRKLPAGHALIAEKGHIRTFSYWDVNQPFSDQDFGIISQQNISPRPSNRNGNTISFKEAAATLQELLSDSVRMRLVSDVPLGILLSGGIDSTSVAAFAVRHSETKVKTFSIGFEEDSFDESRFARMAAKYLGTEHYEERLSADSAGRLLPEIAKWLDEPLADGSLIPTYLLAKFVRSHVTVALGGDGGDELFAGYPMYFAHRLAEHYLALPKAIRNSIIEPIVNSLPVSTNNLSFDYRAKRFVRASHLDEITRHHAWFGSFSIEQHKQLFTPDVLNSTRNDIYEDVRLAVAKSGFKDDVARMQYADVKYYLSEDILTKVDRASMAVSLETRAPFLDPRIGHFAFSLPTAYKLRGRKGKLVLKEAVKDLLPREILNRNKKGFGIPIASWLKTHLKSLMLEMLDRARLEKQGLFQPEYVETLINEHLNSKASHHKEIWSLLVFQLWYDRYLSK